MFKKMEILKPFGTPGFVVGIGLAALAYMVGPSLKKNAKSFAVKGMQGAMMAGEAASHVVENGKEKVSGMFQNMVGEGRESVTGFAELVEELRNDRDRQNSILEDLANTVKGIQEELNTLKNTPEHS